MRKDLKEVRKLYTDGVNIIDYFKNRSDSKEITSEMITISYDLQAGSYIQESSKKSEWENEYSNAYAKMFDQLEEYDSILEVGIGEAATLYNILSRVSNVPSEIYGFDISYSKMKYAMNFLEQNNINNSTLFLGDLFNAPIQDNAIDVVYTNHALEPNGGRERESLSELYRITNKYLILFEPLYEIASHESKKYMEKHGYIQNLHSTAVELGYKVIEYKILFERNPVSLNNWGVLIIEKNSSNKTELSNPLACPIVKAPLELVRNNYYCKESLLLYPVVDRIPCLLPGNAIIATHYLDDLQKI